MFEFVVSLIGHGEMGVPCDWPFQAIKGLGFMNGQRNEHLFQVSRVNDSRPHRLESPRYEHIESQPFPGYSWNMNYLNQ